MRKHLFWSSTSCLWKYFMNFDILLNFVILSKIKHWGSWCWMCRHSTRALACYVTSVAEWNNRLLLREKAGEHYVESDHSCWCETLPCLFSGFPQRGLWRGLSEKPLKTISVDSHIHPEKVKLFGLWEYSTLRPGMKK